MSRKWWSWIGSLSFCLQFGTDPTGTGRWARQGQVWAMEWIQPPAPCQKQRHSGGKDHQTEGLFKEGGWPCSSVNGHPCQGGPRSLGMKMWPGGKMSCTLETLLWHLLSYTFRQYSFKDWKNVNKVLFSAFVLVVCWFSRARWLNIHFLGQPRPAAPIITHTLHLHLPDPWVHWKELRHMFSVFAWWLSD